MDEGANGGRRRPIVMEDQSMFSRRAAFPSIHRATAMALAAAFSLTVFVPSPASAGSAQHGKGFTTASDGITDISARRREQPRLL